MTTSRKAASLPSAWRLLRGSFKTYFKYWQILVGLTVVVALPSGLVALAAGTSGSDTATAYSSFAALIMNLALIWTVMRLEAGDKISLKSAYYQGTAAAVRFFLVTLVLVLQLIPFVIGAIFFSNATIGAITPVTFPERLLIGALWLVLALPSLYWLTRYSFAFFTVNEPDMTPVLALRASRLAVKGRSWAVFGRLIFIIAVLILATLLPTVSILLWLPAKLSSIGLAVSQLLVSLTLLPILYIYLYKLYRSL